MSFSDLFFGFGGRINRARWWAASIALSIVSGAIAAANWIAIQDEGIGGEGLPIWGWLTYLLAVLVLWPILAVSVKRWHDRGKSGWWVLINLVPVIGSLWSLVELGFLPGSPGTNAYGADPLSG